MTNILILGGGWYGCFIAKLLEKHNINYLLLEKNDNLFSESSSKNQNRLHLGFHYPRSEDTINECIKGYKLFHKHFGEIIIDNELNYYFIHNNSKISMKEYINTYNKYNLSYEMAHIPIELNKDNFQGVIKVNEKIINHIHAKEYFLKHIPVGKIEYNYDISKLFVDDNHIKYNNKSYDYLIDCTYGQSNISRNILTDHILIYEACISLIYERKNKNINYSITVMDGLFYSLYPYPNINNQDYYTLTDVEFTPIIKSNDINKIRNIELTSDKIILVIQNMENKISRDYPNFSNDFTYVDYFISYKCKYDTDNDNRSIIFDRKNRIFAFVGGKITGIFEMKQILKNNNIL